MKRKLVMPIKSYTPRFKNRNLARSFHQHYYYMQVTRIPLRTRKGRFREYLNIRNRPLRFTYLWYYDVNSLFELDRLG